VDEFMTNQSAVAPTIRPDKNPIPESESSGERREELHSISGGAKVPIDWNGNASDLQQPDFLRILNANFCGVSGLIR